MVASTELKIPFYRGIGEHNVSGESVHLHKLLGEPQLPFA